MTRFGHKLNYVINTFVKHTPDQQKYYGHKRLDVFFVLRSVLTYYCPVMHTLIAYLFNVQKKCAYYGVHFILLIRARDPSTFRSIAIELNLKRDR